MGTAFVAVLTSKLPWKTRPRMALGGCVLARDNPLGQSWPELQVSVSISEYPEELQVRSETSGKMKL